MDAMHYVINIAIGLLAGVGLVEASLFLLACFLSPAEFDWEEDE